MESKPSSASPWLRSPTWDSTWLLCAIWLLLLGLAFKDSPQFETGYIACVFAFWIAHRVSTLYLAYCSPAYRTLIRVQKGRFVFFPLLITSGVFLFLFTPEEALPLAVPQRMFLLLLVDYFLNLHHFALQHYGIVSIYRARAGQAPTSRWKSVEKAYCIVVGGVLVLAAEIVLGAFLFQKEFGLSEASADKLIYVQVGATVAIGSFTLFLLAREWERESNPSLPKSLYLASLGGLVISGFYLNPFIFIGLWTIQHWIVAVGLAAHMAENDARTERPLSLWYRIWNWPNRRYWGAALVLGVVSVLLLPILEIEAADSGDYYGGFLIPGLPELLSSPPWLRICVALGFVSAFIHYALDRAVYRFSDPKTRACSLPLLMKRPRD